jgi:phage-related tail fiber protein
MAIEKLSEFAKDGQKNTDDLNLTDGFPVSKKPARQWFNWLFNTLTTKINEIIDGKLDSDATAVAAQKLQTSRQISFSGAATGSFNFDGSKGESCVLTLANSGAEAGTYGTTLKIPVITVNAKGLITTATTQDIPTASTTVNGLVQLNNTLTSTSTSQALTVAQGKVLNDQAFGVGQTWQDVKANRVTGTTYANTTGKPILVVVNTYDGTSIVDGVTLRYKGNDTEGDWSFIVPSGSTYSVTGNIRSWAELR